MSMDELFNAVSSALADLGDLSRVGLALLLVVIAGLISRWQRAGLERDLFVASARAFVQLIAVGYLLELVFNLDSALWTTLLLVVMVVIAGRTAGRRGKQTPHPTRIALVSIAFGSVATIGVLVLAGVFDYTPQTIIPIGGMVIGNAMTVAAVVMDRMSDDLLDHRGQVEAKLALGATSRQASQAEFRRGLRNAMIPHLDTTKTVGLIKLPGAMTGMILAGASPLQAVRLQIIVMYMLVGAAAFTGLSAAYLTYRAFFTGAQQLRDLRRTAEG